MLSENLKEQHRDMVKRKDLVFVYGTLMCGMGNNAILRNSTFYSTAVTVDKMAMVSSGIPFVSDKRMVNRVLGEVWEPVSAETWARLDALEGHPNFYTRRRTVVKTEDDGEYLVWMYFCDHRVNDVPECKLRHHNQEIASYLDDDERVHYFSNLL
jgi:gamma-glutamylcyclotransferase (GGCT)/AIG2-like uncharacterized protein YtfP